MARGGDPSLFPPRLFCDTSFFYACLDPNDANHERAREASRRAAMAHSRLHATWDVVSETATLLRYRCGYNAAASFITTIRPLLSMAALDDHARAEAERLFLSRGRVLRLSMCDAVSYVAVTKVLGGIPCLSFDRDFRGLGLNMTC